MTKMSELDAAVDAAHAVLINQLDRHLRDEGWTNTPNPLWKRYKQWMDAVRDRDEEKAKQDAAAQTKSKSKSKSADKG